MTRMNGVTNFKAAECGRAAEPMLKATTTERRRTAKMRHGVLLVFSLLAFEIRASQAEDHWAFRPVTSPEPPPVKSNAPLLT